MRDNSYIPLFRSIQKWEWYKDGNTMRLFLHVLLNANISASKFEGIEIKRGQMIASYPKLSENLNISVQSLRTAIKHLKSTGELTVTKYPKFSVITVNNYEKFNVSTGKLTVNQQATNSQLTVNQQHYKKNNKKNKKDKERKNILSNNINIYNGAQNADNNPPSLDDVKYYIAEKNLNVDAEKFYSLYSSKGWVSAKGFPIDYRSKLEEWHRTELKQLNSKKQHPSEIPRTVDMELAEKMLRGEI